MTKEQYKECFMKEDYFNILYEMYKEKFNSGKHKEFLPMTDFLMILQSTGYIDYSLKIAFHHFEQKFGLKRILDKNNQVIGIV